MSKAFIKSLGSCIKKVSSVQELLLRQKKPDEDTMECIDNLDSVINTLHGLQEEEKQIAQFEGNFLDSRFEEEDTDEDENEE